MMKRIVSFILLAGCLSALCLPLAHAEAGYAIAAIVDDEVISKRDVEQRLRMALAASGGASSEKNIQTLLPQIIRVMVDEKLYTQEANRLGLQVTDKDVEYAMGSLEKQNGLPAGSFPSFLQARNVPKDSFTEQLKAQIAWNKVLARKVRPQVTVSESEIDQELQHLLTQNTSERVFISEILLPIEDASPTAVREAAISLSQQLKNGASFESLARQFSRSSTAADGGKIGWVETRQLSTELRAGVAGIAEGGISDPISTPNGYAIVKVHERKTSSDDGTQAKENIKVTMKQIFVPFASDKADRARIEKTRESLQNIRGQMTDCGVVESLAPRVKGGAKTDTITSVIKELHPEVRAVVRDLDVNRPSPVIQTSMGLHLFMVCEKEIPSALKAQLPERQEVRERLIEQKVSVKARRYLRDLRRNAFVEIRS
ncbi:MAG: chaperone SurA [Rickettsiales bacterium]|jgi:peptidyl-prolyl cis-trans isomerase SurA|nr:chaperone SurA [Rickettsiales bacterium]